ncbi:TonB-dependent receptor [Thalassospira sp. MA62]|nr:TonB-dependent receptor [Thalassospira sp. MA62]
MSNQNVLMGLLCSTTILCHAGFAPAQAQSPASSPSSSSPSSSSSASSSQSSSKSAIDLPAILVTAPANNAAISTYNPQQNKTSYAYSDGADYLKSLPGMTAGRSSGHGLELFLRGQSQNQLNVIADDAFIFGGCPNRMDPPSAYLDIDSFDEITITRGYQTVLNGPGATGGAIVLKRHAPELGEAFSVSGNITGGFDTNSQTWNSGMNMTGGTQDAYVRAHASYRDADNYEDGNGNDVRSAYEDRSGGMTIGFTPGDSHLYFSYDKNRVDDSLGMMMDAPLSDSDTFRAGFETTFDSGIVRRIDVSSYASLVDHVMDNYSLRTSPVPSMMNPSPFRSVDSSSDTYGGKVETDLALGGQIVTTSVEYRRNNRDADRSQGASESTINTLQSVMWPDITADEVGLAAETTFDLDNANRLVVGGRYDFVVVDYGRAGQVAAGSGQSANDLYRQFYGTDADRHTEHNFGGLLRFEHDLDDSMTLFTGVSRAVRTADATERGIASYMAMMGNNMSMVGNPNLSPEKHHQFDLGFTKHTASWSFTGSAYVNHVNDYILRDSARGQDGVLLSATGATVYRNIDALLSGLEIQGEWDVTPDINISGNATYTYGQNLDDDTALAQIAPLQGALGVQWRAIDDLQLGGNMRWAMKQARVDTDNTTGSGRDFGKTGGYAIFDLNATVMTFDPASVTFGISNLFDHTYANHLNRSSSIDGTEYQVNEPGRSFFVQANVPF